MNLESAFLKTISKPASTGGTVWNVDLIAQGSWPLLSSLKERCQTQWPPKWGSLSLLALAISCWWHFFKSARCPVVCVWSGDPSLAVPQSLWLRHLLLKVPGCLVSRITWRGPPMWSLMSGFVVSFHRIQKAVCEHPDLRFYADQTSTSMP